MQSQKDKDILKTGPEYNEKRDFFRMTINTEFTYTVCGENNSYTGFCKDLSHTGIRFITEHALQDGTRIEISFDTKDSRFKPMHAKAEIIRSEFKNNKYAVAGKMLEYK